MKQQPLPVGEIESQLPPDAWLCRIDPAQFEAAILNLAVNARDAMDRSGRLAITTENVTIADCGYAAGLNPGDYIVVSVSDTGCGMSEDVLLRAFEPFYTTKGIGKGTGLGLSQVYGFAKQSGGTAQIESEAGRGTTVHIYIPRQEAPLPGPTRPVAHRRLLRHIDAHPFVPGAEEELRERCDEAGLLHCSAHGLRKAGATIAAENGVSAVPFPLTVPSTDKTGMTSFGALTSPWSSQISPTRAAGSVTPCPNRCRTVRHTPSRID